MFIDVNFRITSSSPTAVSFAWDAVDNCKYNIFRALFGVSNYGAFEKVNEELIEPEVFTDTTGIAGRVYIYFVRAIPNFYSEAIDGPYDGSISNFIAGGPYPASSPGVDVVRQIVESAYARIASFVGTTVWQRLPYPRNIEKNAANIKFGYAVLPKEAAPGEPQVFGSYCLSLNLEVVFYQQLVKNSSEAEIASAELDLHTWADRAAKDFRKYRLFLPNLVLNVKDHSIALPEYNSNMTAVALRVTFPVVFRQSVNL